MALKYEAAQEKHPNYLRDMTVLSILKEHTCVCDRLRLDSRFLCLANQKTEGAICLSIILHLAIQPYLAIANCYFNIQKRYCYLLLLFLTTLTGQRCYYSHAPLAPPSTMYLSRRGFGKSNSLAKVYFSFDTNT